MKSRKYKLITQAEFDNLKLMQEAGLTQSQIKKISGRSTGSISTIYHSQTLEEYRNKRRVIDKTPVANASGNPEQGVNSEILKTLQALRDLMMALDERLINIEHSVSRRNIFNR